MKSGYKQTEVGVIPEEWEVKSLRELGKWQGGMTPSMQNPDFWINGTVPWISSGDVKTVQLKETGYYITNEAVRQGTTTMLPAGSIVLVTRSGILRKYLPVATNVVPMAINQDIKALIPEKDVSSWFVLHALTERGPKILSRCMKAGTTVESVEFKWLKAFELALPPLPEQRAIAGALSEVDALLGAQEALLAKKRDLKAAAMQQLLTGQKRLPSFTGEWEVKRMPDVCWFQEGPGVRNTQFTTSGVKLLNGTNIFRGRINLDTTERFISEREASGPYAHFLADCGDVVIACSGISVEKFHEKVAVVSAKHLPFCMNTSTMRFKPNQSSLVRDYLCHFLMSDLFKTQIAPQATGSAQLNFGPSHVSCVTLKLPTFSEQTAIAAVLSDMDAEIAALEAQRDKTRSLKQGMMQELLTGRIRLV